MCYNTPVTQLQTNIFISDTGKYFGKKCFLSFLVPCRKSNCVTTMRDKYFFGAFLHWSALFYFGGMKMRENTTAKVLKGIGIAIMIICFIGALIVGGETTNELIPITFIVSGIISGTMFIGFGEIINLLQKNANKQDDILQYLKDQAVKEKNAPKTVIQDIEDNLPNM